MERLRDAAERVRHALERFLYWDENGYLSDAYDELHEALAAPTTNHSERDLDMVTAPPQRKPLTDEELDALAIDEDGLPNSHFEFARAIERAHGIGGKE